jgi:phage terminase small subunit
MIQNDKEQTQNSIEPIKDQIVTNGLNGEDQWGDVHAKKQRLFIIYYTDVSNQFGTFLQGAKSAVQAGYSNKGTAQMAAYLLSLQKIREVVNRRLDAVLPDRQGLASLLYRMANSNMGNLAADIKTAEDLRDHPQSANIKRVKIQTTYREGEKDSSETHVMELESVDPLAAARELGKLMKFYDRTIFSANINQMLEGLDLSYATEEELDKLNEGKDIEQTILAIQTRQQLGNIKVIEGEVSNESNKE